jgi:hypothetical protein
MTAPTPQRIITISINGTGELADVYYTYASPVTGLSYINCPVCDMVADRAINSLFALDYFSSQNGWTITGVSPRGSSPAMEAVPGPLQLSVMTVNPYTNLDVYNFFIHYQNTVSGAVMQRDPQMGNIRPPL